MPHLLCLGYGFTAKALIPGLLADGWSVSATYRQDDVAATIEADGCTPQAFDQVDFTGFDHVLSSIPPGPDGDPALKRYAGNLIDTDQNWVGYLSTTGVYGDTGGTLVDESAQLNPTAERSKRRMMAEADWLNLTETPVHVFRLAGIYGAGRSTLDSLRNGTARRIERPGFAFSRTHVEDIAAVLRASMAAPRAGAVYNVCDDEPASQSDVVAYAAKLLGVEPPPVLAYEDAEPEMSPMARSFWQDNRRVSNELIKTELGVKLIYPTYREGLRAIHIDEGGLTY